MTYESSIFLTFLTALFAALFVMPKLSYIANRIGLVDQPNVRKIHFTPRPLVGGLGIVISATFSSLLFVPLGGLRGFFSGLAVLLLVGFFDDYMEMGHRKKFLAQILATALLIYFSNVQLSNFGDLLGFGDIVIPLPVFLIWCVTVFCVVGVTNAVNMIDGLDGLAGGVSFLAFLTFAVFSSMAGNSTLMLLNLAFSGAILGFLKYNWSPSVLFMGDSGSLCLGFSLSFMAIALTQPEGSIVPPISMLLVLAVPISDTIGVMTKRLLRRTSPFKPDKTHLHHALLQAGLSDSHCVVIMLLLTTLFCLLGIWAIMFNIPEPILFFVFLSYFCVNYFFASILAYVQKIAGFPVGERLPDKSSVSGREIIQGSGKWRVYRASHRYDTDLPVTYREARSDIALSGRLLNVSQDGFLAQIVNLEPESERCQVTFHYTLGEVQTNSEFPAEHLWTTEDYRGKYHGFCFCEMNLQQQQHLQLLLEKVRKNEINR